jgi:hypothetical protein
VYSPIAPALCASLPWTEVRLRLSETDSTWKITRIPIKPITSPTRISTRLMPRAHRRAADRKLNLAIACSVRAS